MLLIYLLIIILIIAIVLIVYGNNHPLPDVNLDSITHADVVIIGAGTAGCILSRKLSQQFPNLKFVVLQKGKDYRNDPLVYNPAKAPYVAYNQPYSTVIPTQYQNVRISTSNQYGGASSHNYCLSVFGSPNLYDKYWQPYTGLNYQQMQPYIDDVQKYIYITPLPITIDLSVSRIMGILREGIGNFAKAWDVYRNSGPLRAGPLLTDVIVSSVKSTTGVTVTNNYNGAVIACVDSTPQMSVDPYSGIRQSTNLKYLPSDFIKLNKNSYGQNDNLIIIPDATVSSLSMTMVNYIDRQNISRTINLNENGKIILSAGAIFNPMILQSSGIGSVEIGKNLTTHYGITVILEIDDLPEYQFSSGPLAFLPTTWDSGRALQFLVTGAADEKLLATVAHDKNKRHFSFLVWNLNPRSVGSVINQQVNLNLYSDGDLNDPQSDLSVSMQAMSWVKRLIATVNNNGINLKSVYPPQQILDSDDKNLILPYILNGISLTDHYCRTCSLGTVVDSQNFLLQGTNNIHVCDASVFPHISDGNTAFPVQVMATLAAERIANHWNK